MHCVLFAKMDEVLSLKKNKNIPKSTLKMEKNTWKVPSGNHDIIT